MLAVSGCGGSDTSAAEGWASDVCSSVSTWKTSVQQITTDAANAIAKPGATREESTNAVQNGVDATQKLVDDLKALGAPDTPEGAQAKDDLDTFTTDTQETIDGVKSALADIPSGAGLAEIVTQLSGQAATLQQAIASGQQLVATSRISAATSRTGSSRPTPARSSLAVMQCGLVRGGRTRRAQ